MYYFLNVWPLFIVWDLLDWILKFPSALLINYVYIYL